MAKIEKPKFQNEIKIDKANFDGNLLKIDPLKATYSNVEEYTQSVWTKNMKHMMEKQQPPSPARR